MKPNVTMDQSQGRHNYRGKVLEIWWKGPPFDGWVYWGEDPEVAETIMMKGPFHNSTEAMMDACYERGSWEGI